jgi:hypothetical protein
MRTSSFPDPDVLKTGGDSKMTTTDMLSVEPDANARSRNITEACVGSG